VNDHGVDSGVVSDHGVVYNISFTTPCETSSRLSLYSRVSPDWSGDTGVVNDWSGDTGVVNDWSGDTGVVNDHSMNDHGVVIHHSSVYSMVIHHGE